LAEWVKEVTRGKGVDLIEDFIGAAYWERNLRCLRPEVGWSWLDLMGGRFRLR